MPNCTSPELPFASLGRRKIEASFEGGDVSSDGGVMLLQRVDQQLGLVAATFREAGVTKVRKFQGVLLQPSRTASGFYLVEDGSEEWDLKPEWIDTPPAP